MEASVSSVTRRSVLREFAEHHEATGVLLLLLILSGSLFFFRLGTLGLFDADEPAYAQAARNMLESRDWITPSVNGVPRFDKPILFYWLITLSYRAFGVTEFAVRLWSALAAVILVLIIAWTARKWFGPPADLLAGLAFTTNILTALLARAAVTDMLLTLFMTLAILAGVEALVEPASGKGWAIMGWAALGLAVLVKGPIGLLIPSMALGGWLVIFRQLRPGLVRLFPWQGPVLFAAMTFPWYILVLAANGWAFVEGFVVKHHVARFTGVISSHAGPLWFYVPVGLVGFFPWSGFLPRAFWQAASVARSRQVGKQADSLLVVCACWAAGVFILFSLAGTKLPSYLFPAFPAMALLIAGTTVSHFKQMADNRATTPGDRSSAAGCEFAIPARPVPRWLDTVEPWLIGITGGGLALGFGITPWILEIVRPRLGGMLTGVSVPLGPVFWLAGVMALGTAGGLASKGPWRATIFVTMMSILILTAEVIVAPQVYAIVQAPLRDFAQTARRVLADGGTLVVYGLNAPTIVFYADHPVVFLGPDSPESLDQIRRLTEADRIVVITRVVHASRLDGLPGLFRLKTRGGYAIYSSLRRSAEGNGETREEKHIDNMVRLKVAFTRRGFERLSP